MALIKIRKFPDPVLRETASEIIDINEEIVKLSEDMVETMYLSQGAGLAANQVGVPVKLIVFDLMQRRERKHLVVLNPVIIGAEGEDTSEEGCLSLPKYYEYVKRAKKVAFKGTTIEGKVFEMECDGRLARAIQHEIDHLYGVLFIDHLSAVKREIFKKKYLKDAK